jgi:hypothetical protein
MTDLGQTAIFSTPLNRVWNAPINRRSGSAVGNAPVSDAGNISVAHVQAPRQHQIKKLKFSGES